MFTLANTNLVFQTVKGFTNGNLDPLTPVNFCKVENMDKANGRKMRKKLTATNIKENTKMI